MKPSVHLQHRAEIAAGGVAPAGIRNPERLGAAVVVALMAVTLSACNDGSAAANRALYVRTELVEPLDRQSAVTLTGEVQARFRADLSFRVSGRVVARFADVGAHVEAGDVLARTRSGRAAGRCRCGDCGGGSGRGPIARGKRDFRAAKDSDRRGLHHPRGVRQRAGGVTQRRSFA